MLPKSPAAPYTGYCPFWFITSDCLRFDEPLSQTSPNFTFIFPFLMFYLSQCLSYNLRHAL